MTRRKPSRRTSSPEKRPQTLPPVSHTTTELAAPFWTLPLVAIIAVGAALRLYYLRQPMRYDESITYVHFAASSWTTAISSYTYPNNHVFHTVLVKACATLFGNNPWVLRLPAFVAGVAMIPATYAVGRRLFGQPAAYVGAALVAGAGALVLYSTNARGYTMICLATLLLATLLLRLRERRSAGVWAAVVVVTSLGLWTVPVMLFPAGGLVLWFGLSALTGDTRERRSDLAHMAVALPVTAILTLLLYSPIIGESGVDALAGNAFVRPSPWRIFFVQLASSIHQVFTHWSLGVPVAIAVVLGICVLNGLLDERRVSGLRVSIAGSMYIWCALVLLVTQRSPLPRVWLFLLAPAALFAAHGMLQLLSHIPAFKVRVAPRHGVFAVALATALAGVVVATRGVVTSRDTGTLPDAETMAKEFAPRLRAGDRIIAPLPSNGPLTYYFVREGVDTSYLSAVPRDSSNVFLIVNTGEGFTVNTQLNEPLMRRYRDALLVVRYALAEVYLMR